MLVFLLYALNTHYCNHQATLHQYQSELRIWKGTFFLLSINGLVYKYLMTPSQTDLTI